ncbi:MAG TPA: Crp/Fnr family transcriptional regulator, partial [Chromatiales bacterium]|nr:Crp/Fnr family transcriptional regulator [Chromatiales bacterium]
MDTRTVPDDELRRLPVLAALSDEQLARVRRGARLVELAEGEHLFEHGQRAERFFMLREGRIKLYRLSPEGDEKVIEIIRPGQSFAEAVMFMEGKRYPVSAQALVRSELVAFDNAVFLQILRESVDTCFRVMAAMSMRLRARVNEIEALALQNATL